MIAFQPTIPEKMAPKRVQQELQLTRKKPKQPPEIEAAQRELRRERGYRKLAGLGYGGTLLISGPLTDVLPLKILDAAFEPSWTRRYSEPFICPKGTKRVYFVDCFPTEAVHQQLKSSPALEYWMLCTSSAELPAHIDHDLVFRRDDWAATVTEFLDDALPTWREKVNIDWLHYYAARAANYAGMTDAERQYARRVLAGIEERQLSWEDMLRQWNPQVEELVVKSVSRKDIARTQEDFEADLASARKVKFAGQPAMLIVNPKHCDQFRELYNLFLGQSKTNAALPLLLVEKRKVADSDIPWTEEWKAYKENHPDLPVRNMSAFHSYDADYSSAAGFVSADPGQSRFWFFTDDEFARAVAT
jgi:hypothetical protein